jgi:hypothetical protein
VVVHSNPLATASTRLGISSWTKGAPPYRSGSATSKNPEKYVQDYLPEPGPVEARTTIDGTILVSGIVNDADRTDQFLFDLLNHEDSAFEFSKIVALVDDVAFSKKRLLSRSARYTGLLDKLEFEAASETGNPLPSPAQLQGIRSWLAVIDNERNGGALEQCRNIVQLLQSIDPATSGLVNVALLLQNANELNSVEGQSVLKQIQAIPGITYTIVAVGKIEDRPEGKFAYHYGTFGEEILPAKAVFSRDESYRLITELLQLECGSNKALCFAEIYNVNATEARLVKGLREAGYARPQEIDHMVRLGPQAYKDAVDEWKKQNPDAAKGYTTNAWWEAEEFQASRRKSDAKAALELEKIKDERTLEIEAIAKEYAKREYFRQSMAGEIDMTEEEYTKSIWDRAMLEGDMKYRIAKGEIVDQDAELADFGKRQERKQAMMLQRAKKELAEIIGEEIPDVEIDPNQKKDDAKNY